MKILHIFWFTFITITSYPAFSQRLIPQVNAQNKIIRPHEKKISSLVRGLAIEMENLGLNAQTAQSDNFAENYNNFLFQVDRDARIRVTITCLGTIAPVLDKITQAAGVIEIIHDLAPGAGLAFSEGFESSVEFINSVNDLVAAGCDVIVDDIGYFSEPWFKTVLAWPVESVIIS